MKSEPIDLMQVKVLPLAQRNSQARLEDILVDPDAPLSPCSDEILRQIQNCAAQIKQARKKDASVMLSFGAHLIKNGGAKILIRLMEQGWITHLATNGAASIHDWEFSFAGLSTEKVKDNVATGTFGTWDETGRNITLALLAGALTGRGYGDSLGQFIAEDGVTLPSTTSLENAIMANPGHRLAPARAEMLQTMQVHQLTAGRHTVKHPFRTSSIFARAFKLNLGMTVHPGIGYDIIATHPMYNGAAVGRAAGVDFHKFANAVEGLDSGVLLSVGSAIMGPQVFEKSLSCVNNLRLKNGQKVVQGHNIYVVDLQDGGNWDWAQGEPPKTSPAYYLRFCKSYSRMGGAMHYAQCDNVAFMQRLMVELSKG